MKAAVVVVVALLACVALADVRFTANLVISNIPGISGVLDGTLYYYYNTTGSYGNWKRFDLAAPIDAVEIYDYTNLTRNKKCSTGCYSETYTNPAERLFMDPATDTLSTGTYLGCNKYTRIGGESASYAYITTIYWDATNSKICRAIFNEGTTYTFSNYVANSAPIALYLERFSWSCPEPECSRVMDLIFLADVGSYIDTRPTEPCTTVDKKTVCTGPSEWSMMIQFIKDVIASYTVGPRASTVGAVFFATTSHMISGLTASVTDIYSRLNCGTNQGHTCLGCGLHDCQTVFANPVPGREDLYPSRVVILMSSGNPNFGNYNDTYEAEVLKNRDNALIISIGIGPDANMVKLGGIASPIPGVETAIHVASFFKLSSIINKLVMQTCSPLPTQDCTGCAGYCTCGKTCVCPTCEASDACTVNTCDPYTKGCVPTQKNCDDGNACTLHSCNPTTGCINTTLSCYDGDACTDDLCLPASGCSFPPKNCPGDACHTPTCSSVTGCGTTNVVCNDGNPCTVDACDTVTGCYSTPVDCDDGNYCTLDSCNPANGACVNTALACDDNNGCTDDTCDQTLGCLHKPITCDDSDVCTIDTCSSLGSKSHKCDNAQILGCTCSGAGYIDCSLPVYKKPCMEGICGADSTGLKSTCIYTNLTSTKCNSGNKCIHDSCDPLTDNCVATPVVCPILPCKDGVCSTATGLCVYTDRTCPAAADLCHTNTCNIATDRCELAQVCRHQSCFDEQCTLTAGNPTCAWTPRDCSSSNMCVLDWCDNSTDTCVHVEVSCDDGNACTIDTCNPATGCVHTNNTCSDGNLCTLDKCDPATGCYNPIKCSDGHYCTEDYCNPVTGTCAFTPLDCSADLSTDEVSCYVGACTEKAKCYKKISASATLDVCGGCIDLISANATTNITEANSACLNSWSNTQLAAVLTSAAVAGIIIAAIIGGLILLAASSFGTYELVKRAKEAQNTHTVSNPLYKDSGREMTSALYSGNN